MHKFIRLRSTKTGNEYEMPVEAIATHRLQAVLTERNLQPEGPAPEQIKAFMTGPVKAIQDEVSAEFQTEEDVRMYCMSVPWNFVAPYTRLIKYGAPNQDLIDDFEWIGGCDEPQPLADLPEGMHAGEVPIDFFLAMMDKQKNNCSLSVMLDGEGRKNCLMVIFRGDQDQVEACQALVSQLAAQIRKFPEGKPPRKIFPH